MKDIAFHITDLTENGVRAGATRIVLALHLDARQLHLHIGDNGCGMDSPTLRRATDPFYTTRTTRRVGLGLPFLFQNAQQCGGSAEVRSHPGRGTEVEARFPLDDIDCPPAGDLAATFMQLMVSYPAVDICVQLRCGGREEQISSAELREAVSDLPLGHPAVASRIRSLFEEMLSEVFADALG